MKPIAQENIVELVKLGHERAAELKASCGAVDVRSLAQLISDLATQLEVQLVRSNALAAENAGLKQIVYFVTDLDNEPQYHDEGMGCGLEDRGITDRYEAMRHGWDEDMERVYGEVIPCAEEIETPSTDAFLAEVWAQARNEGINYAAGRLAAAFNHGFVDKPLTEVCDMVRMILDTKEELENSPLPAADGLSGEYAEKFLTEFAGYARKGEEL